MSDRERNKPTPKSPETEREVLGACISRGNSWWEHLVTVSGMEDPADLFYDPDHYAIAQAIEGAYKNREKVSQATVSDRLVNAGREEMGMEREEPSDFVFRVGTSTGVSTMDELDRAVERLKNLVKRRSVIEALERVASNAYDENVELPALTGELEDVAKSAMHSGFRPLRSFGDLYEEVMSAETPPWVIPTGIPTLDDLLGGGWEAGRTYVIAGGSGAGKTSVMFRCVRAASYTQTAHSIVLSYESPKQDVLAKMLSGHSSAEWKQVRQSITTQDREFKGVDEEDREGVLEAVSLFSESRVSLLFSDDFVHGIEEIPTYVMSARDAAEDPDLPVIVFIDYIQLAIRDARFEREELSEMTRRLHQIAASLGITIVMLSQFTKMEPGQRPFKSDLHGSGSIEKDADGIVLLHRPGLAPDSDEGPEKMIIHLAKNRVGEEPEWNLVFDGSRCVVEEETDEIIQAADEGNVQIESEGGRRASRSGSVDSGEDGVTRRRRRRRRRGEDTGEDE